jgi:flagellar biosynthetic protein FliP
MKSSRLLLLLLLVLSCLLLTSCAGSNQLQSPGVTLSVEPAGKPKEVSTGIQLLVILTVLTLAPTIIIMMTSFTRIVVVLALMKNAIGAPTVPPAQIITGLALLLTFFIMAPVYNKINETALRPKTLDDIPTVVLLPAFVINELRIAFLMGFVIYVPFLVIDIVISSILLAMGMMMLPPTVVSLPFKLLLFVMVDGWYLITRSLALSFYH